MASIAQSSLSLDSILFLQQWPHPWLDEAAVALTLLGDPKVVFLYLAPLVYWCAPRHCRRSLGMEMLLGLVMADILNALLKWPARGDRPYWFSEQVREFSVTCESGFGMPSGHMMVSTCVLRVVLARVPRRWKAASVLASSVFLILLGLTRMYVGAHFPEQVLCGAVCGLMLGHFILRGQLEAKLTKHWQLLQRHASSANAFLLHAVLLGAAGSLTILFVAVVEFALLSLFTDPLHSLQLAREGCEATRAALMAAAADATDSAAADAAAEQAHFQLERGPFMGVMRDAGVCLGGAVALALLQLCALDDTAHPRATHATSPPPGSNGAAAAAQAETDAWETVPLQGSNVRSGTTSAVKHLPGTGATPESWREVALRACFGLLESYAFQRLMVFLLDSSLTSALAESFPVAWIYGKNFVLFAAITLNCLVAVPLLWRTITTARSSNSSSATLPRP